MKPIPCSSIFFSECSLSFSLLGGPGRPLRLLSSVSQGLDGNRVNALLPPSPLAVSKALSFLFKTLKPLWSSCSHHFPPLSVLLLCLLFLTLTQIICLFCSEPLLCRIVTVLTTGFHFGQAETFILIKNTKIFLMSFILWSSLCSELPLICVPVRDPLD